MLTTRAQVGTGSNITVVGFTVDGVLDKRLLIRAPGYQLTSHGARSNSGILSDPVIRLFNAANELIAFNDDWPSFQPELIAAAALVGAPAFGNSTPDSALLVTLSPGNYTVELIGYSESNGEGMLEIFEVDAQRAATAVPVLTWIPSSQLGVLEGDALFSVHAVGKPAVTYRWRRNGVDISGATTPVLYLPTLQ
ncbi:MAG: hypothetical protein EXS37_20110 [Opitutus sp.]|nr:hypothetical protein [Opitutus sp.]